MTPAFQGRTHHEQIARAIALILAVNPRGLPGLGRDRHARFTDQLLGGLVDTDHGVVWIARPVINSSTSSMAATKAALASEHRRPRQR